MVSTGPLIIYNNLQPDAANEGFKDGLSVGQKMGSREGFKDSLKDGPLLGSELGSRDSFKDGFKEALSLSFKLGCNKSSDNRSNDVCKDGLGEGFKDGSLLGLE